VFEPLDFLRDDVLLEFGETWVGFLGRRSVFRDLNSISISSLTINLIQLSTIERLVAGRGT
jgi:hypothetical protein